MRKLLLLLFILPITLLSTAQYGKEPVKVTDMLKIKSISGVNLSKDGSKAVFTVTSIEPEGDSKLEHKKATVN